MLPPLLVAALASTLRMLSAYVLSVLTALVAGVAMARSRAVESVLLPVLDILQSIPILGFFPAALLFFVSALPRGWGQEVAAVFLIFTSQVWNLIFGVYSSVKSLDPSLFDMAKVYRMGRAATFFYVCVPAARNSLIANSLISWAGGWFFLTSSEVISMGSEEYRLVGLGTYIVEAFERGDTVSFGLGMAVLVSIIMATYLLVWNAAAQQALGRRLPSLGPAYEALRDLVSKLWGALGDALVGLSSRLRVPRYAWRAVGAALAAYLAAELALLISGSGGLGAGGLLPTLAAVLAALPVSLARVAAVVALSAALSLAAAYACYRSERAGPAVILAGEVLASIPAILWWPLLAGLAARRPYGPYVVSGVIFLQGSLWYLFFNLMVYGLASLRREVEEMASVYRVRGWWYLRCVFVPFLMPSLAAGALSAWGGAWNASIAAEYVDLGGQAIDLGGVGALMSKLASSGDYAGVTASALLLSLTIVLFNKTFWRRLFKYVEERYGGEVE